LKTELKNACFFWPADPIRSLSSSSISQSIRLLNTGNIKECEGAGLGRNLNEEGVTKVQPEAEQALMRVLGLKLKSMIVSLLQGA
jgi:hypothetical protein